MVKQKVVIVFIGYAASCPNLAPISGNILFLQAVMATILFELLRGFVGFLENSKILGETRQSDFQEYTPLSGMELGKILRCNQLVFFKSQSAYFMIHFSFRTDKVI